METTLKQLIQSNTDYTVRTEMLDGREHIVVPVIMMTEGVHNGSRGPMLHTAEELGRIPAAFNGIPVTVQHPQDKEGNFISANSPGVLAEYSVGRIFGTQFVRNGLRAEAWLDVQRLAAISPEVIEYVNQRRPLEVSIGVFTDEEEAEGDYNGEHYTAIARNHRPDHLALLPGGVGACSWTDGCGIRANQSNSNSSKTNKKGGSNVMADKDKFPEIYSTYKDMNNSGMVVKPLDCLADPGYKQLVDSARHKLDRMDDDMKIHFLEEMFQDHLIYTVHRRDGTTELYKRTYSVDQSGEIEFTGDPVKVIRNVEYTVQELKRTRFNNNSKDKEDTMEIKVHACAPCEEKLKALIAHKATHFTDEDREWLVGLSEAQIDKLMPIEQAEPKKTAAPAVNTEEVKEKVVEALSDEDKAALAYGKQQMKTRQNELIQSIQANAKDVWTVDELNAKGLDDLEKIAKSLRPVTDYSALRGGETKITNNSDEVLIPTGIELE